MVMLRVARGKIQCVKLDEVQLLQRRDCFAPRDEAAISVSISRQSGFHFTSLHSLHSFLFLFNSSFAESFRKIFS